MKPMSMCRVVTIIFLLCGGLNLAPVYADDEGALGDSAFQSGKLRQAFTHYLAGYQAALEAQNAEMIDSLRLKVIGVVRRLVPPPALPDEAIAHEGRAEAAVKSAQKPADFADAAKEYLEAIRIAPWVTAHYFNLGVVLEKQGDRAGAIRYLNIYLQAAPDAPDAVDVKRRSPGLRMRVKKNRKMPLPRRQPRHRNGRRRKPNRGPMNRSPRSLSEHGTPLPTM